jgi:hypothetical protein
MKATKISALLFAILFATTAFAAANKSSFEITEDVVVGGKTLSAGKYNVTWEGQGPNVDLNVSHGKQVVATISAHLRDLPSASISNAISVKNNPDGTRALSQIQFGGKKYVLEIGGSNGQTDVASRVK